jgi:hypothetical protein
MSKVLQVAAALGFAAAAVFASTGTEAAPVPTSIGKIGATAGSSVTDVQYRRWRGGGGGRGWRGGYGWRGYGWRYPYRYGYGYGWGWPYYYGAGVVAGAAIATAPYYYAPPVYTAPPPSATVSGAGRQCWVTTDSSRNYGYWRPC